MSVVTPSPDTGQRLIKPADTDPRAKLKIVYGTSRDTLPRIHLLLAGLSADIVTSRSWTHSAALGTREAEILVAVAPHMRLEHLRKKVGALVDVRRATIAPA
ncbi:hypothetical protein ACMTN4_00475 (plasmid) [Rhodococcus globerulus]|uniref:hypothetical protein n=1 Tax=Rhodococcus globerulus TaxID=33008 RepID=UPI0039ED0F39